MKADEGLHFPKETVHVKAVLQVNMEPKSFEDFVTKKRKKQLTKLAAQQQKSEEEGAPGDEIQPATRCHFLFARKTLSVALLCWWLFDFWSSPKAWAVFFDRLGIVCFFSFWSKS